MMNKERDSLDQDILCIAAEVLIEGIFQQD